MMPLLKRLVVGTPLEPVARRMWRRVRPPRGDAGLDPDDRLACEIMARVLRPDSNCVDVGCSTGKLLAHMVRLAPRGRHFAFEPIPAHAAELRRRFPGVSVHEMAVSDAPGEATFQHVVSNPGYSGLRQRTYPSTDEKIETLHVETVTLDSMLPPELPVHLLKVDVEGAELQVFRGATRTLRTHRPVVLFEHGRGGADHYGTTPEMVYDLLAGACGLRISILEDWLAGRPALDRTGFAAQFQGLHWNFVAHP
jgi:FkbM family methyltransferase